MSRERAGNVAVDRDNGPGVIVIRCRESCRHANLLAVLLCLLPFATHSACWEIVLTDKTITATDVWQIRDRVTGDSVLLGVTGDGRHAVSLDQIRSITPGEGGEASWLSGSRIAVEMQIRLIDGQTIVLVSEMNLYYLADNKRHAVPLGDVVSVNRCDDESTGVSAPPEIVDSQRPSPFLIMKNGDRLYGEVVGHQLGWQTSYASVEFKPAEIKVIRAGCEAPSTGMLETLAGDQLDGSFIDISISFHLTTGQIMDIPTDQIKMIDFVGTQAADRITIKECNNDH